MSVLRHFSISNTCEFYEIFALAEIKIYICIYIFFFGQKFLIKTFLFINILNLKTVL
jgi:hypothetical protein